MATAASYNLNLLPKDQNLIGFTLSGTDADGDSLTYSIVSGPSQGTVSLSGANVTYQTNSGVDTAQTDTFTFKVNDGTADSDPATISVNLKPILFININGTYIIMVKRTLRQVRVQQVLI